VDSWWKDEDAATIVRELGARGIGEPLALRIYTTRLLGRQPRLVLHGGGNTSVKLISKDPAGEEIDVLHVKGSGWDMADIEAPGLPAVRLRPLQALRTLDVLSDEDMVDVLRANLLSSRSPNPSVETLLHAYLPQKYIDHTHSTALLALIDQPNSAELVEEVYGQRVALVPYIIPGFELAKLAATVFEANPSVEGLILDKHGIFTFGTTARESYERMIELVTLAEQRLRQDRKTLHCSSVRSEIATVECVAPIVRSTLSEPLGDGCYRRWVLEFRTSPEILDFIQGDELGRYAAAGVVTPDHVIRTKAWPLILPAANADDLDGFAAAARTAVTQYSDHYKAYFEQHNSRVGGIKTMLDTIPRIVLVPGLGMFAAGKSARDARIAADVYQSAIGTITDAEAIGRFQPINEADTFDMEYWSLEQAKLGSARELPLARQVAVITGGAGTIGLATARAFAAAGADIVIMDRAGKALDRAGDQLGPHALVIACDLTQTQDLDRAFAQVCRSFGGVDILVSNAGSAPQGAIADLPEVDLRASFEINFFAHQAVAQRAVHIMQRQGTGGCLLFNVSKQAVNPGPNFGAYGLPKAATLFLSRQYALEHGSDGIRSNAVNADRIRSGMLTDEMIIQRSGARGLKEADYMSGNLLGLEVKAEDVAKAFVDLALSPKTTACVITVDGGNIAAALR